MSGTFLLVLLATAAGIFLYYVDMKRGKALRRKWYNLTHKDPVQGEMPRGFIAGHSLRYKWLFALVLGVLTLLLTYLTGSLRLIDDTLIALAIGIGLALGFVLAPLVLRSLPGSIALAKELVDKAGALEEKYVGDRQQETSTQNSGQMPTAESGLTHEEEKSADPIDPNKASEETRPDDWRKGIDDYLKK